MALVKWKIHTSVQFSVFTSELVTISFSRIIKYIVMIIIIIIIIIILMVICTKKNALIIQFYEI